MVIGGRMTIAKEQSNSMVSKNINYLLIRDNKTRKQVCSDLNIKYTTFCDWVNGRIIPRYSNLEKLGVYFKVEAGDFYIDMEANDKILAAKRLLKYAEGFRDNSKELDMNVLRNLSDEQVKELLEAGFSFRHKSYEERLAECGGVAQTYKFDWGEPKGREMF